LVETLITERNRKWWTVAVMALATIFITIDLSGVMLALPNIGKISAPFIDAGSYQGRYHPFGGKLMLDVCLLGIYGAIPLPRRRLSATLVRVGGARRCSTAARARR
jgi:hypothetical protein